MLRVGAALPAGWLRPFALEKTFVRQTAFVNRIVTKTTARLPLVVRDAMVVLASLGVIRPQFGTHFSYGQGLLDQDGGAVAGLRQPFDFARIKQGDGQPIAQKDPVGRDRRDAGAGGENTEQV